MEFRAIVFLTAMLIFCRIKNSKSIVNDKWINSGNSQIVFSSLALNWNDASLHCHRYGAGLLHRNNFTVPSLSCIFHG